MKKTISLLKWENGFVNPIRVRQGPQGGAYLMSEIAYMVPDEDQDDVEVVVYEIGKVTTYKLSELGGIDE